jgi:hypothetical protein
LSHAVNLGETLSAAALHDLGAVRPLIAGSLDLLLGERSFDMTQRYERRSEISVRREASEWLSGVRPPGRHAVSTSPPSRKR